MEREKYIPELYRQRGSFGNNTTISEEERSRNANAEPEQGNLEGRLQKRGEEALHIHYVEWGIAPTGTWEDFEGITIPPLEHPWNHPFGEQPNNGKTKQLSKNERNMKLPKTGDLSET